MCYVFFALHLSAIFFHAVWTTLDGYWNFHHNKLLDIPVLKWFKQHRLTTPYYLLSGINTGYGFYGIKASTEKFFRVSYYGENDSILKVDNYFGLTRSNGIARLGSFSSYMTNYIGDTDRLTDSNQINIKEIDDKVLAFRRDYILKIFKWMGRSSLSSSHEAYKVDLITVLPKGLTINDDSSKLELYVIQEGFYEVE